MKRILRLSTLAGAMVAAAWMASLAPVSQREANAGTFYYGGGYAPGYYGGYSGYGYRPYGYGGYGYTSAYGYADSAPGRPISPSYRAYGFGNGFGTGGTYRGMYNGNIDHAYGTSRFYGQPDPPAYNPYGNGPYGFRAQHDYGY